MPRAPIRENNAMETMAIRGIDDERSSLEESCEFSTDGLDFKSSIFESVRLPAGLKPGGLSHCPGDLDALEVPPLASPTLDTLGGFDCARKRSESGAAASGPGGGVAGVVGGDLLCPVPEGGSRGTGGGEAGLSAIIDSCGGGGGGGSTMGSGTGLVVGNGGSGSTGGVSTAATEWKRKSEANWQCTPAISSNLPTCILTARKVSWGLNGGVKEFSHHHTAYHKHLHLHINRRN